MKSKEKIHQHLQEVDRILSDNAALRTHLKRNGTCDLTTAQMLDTAEVQYQQLKSQLKRHLWCRSS